MARRGRSAAVTAALTVGVLSLAALAEPPDPPVALVAVPVPSAPSVPPVVCVWTLKGEWGDRFASKPITEAVREAERLRPALLVIEVDSTHIPPRELMVSAQQVPEAAVARLWHAYVDVIPALRALHGLKTVPIVVHVRSALGSAGSVPWMGQRYMTPSSRWGGINQAWEWVPERRLPETPRSYSLTPSRLLNLVASRSKDSSSADVLVAKAMVRFDYVLSVSFISGKPVFFEDMTSGEELLTDDGNADAGRADPMEDYVAYRGNDVLTLDAPLAERLGVIAGIAETLDDVLRREGFDPAAVRIDRSADAIFDRWVVAVVEARRQIAAHWSSIQVLAGPDLAPPSDPEHLKCVKASVTRILELIEIYGCAIDVSTIDGQPPVIKELVDILARMQGHEKQPR